MIKQRTVLEVKIGDREYELYCKSDSPLGELHDALMQMKGYCVERMQNAHKEELQASEAIMKEEIEESGVE